MKGILKMIKNKNILLCVSGSIAIYKALELTRLYIKAGANVKVLMSESAKRFISPLTFEAISTNKVLHVKTESWDNKYNHIQITKNIDVVILAPATANTINKLNFGIADTLLTQTLLANTKPLLIAPSMNTNMLKNQATQNSLKSLQSKGIHIINPISKKLACLDEGDGALAEIEDIFYHTCKLIKKDSFWEDKRVLITGGGTKEKIDDVRYIGNFSSGLMAQNLALVFFIKGAKVTLLTSKKKRDFPFKVVNFSDTKSLKLHVNKLAKKHDYLFMAAAVSDYAPKQRKKGKFKKQELGENWDLNLRVNDDILAQIKGIKKIGFKAEFDKKNALKNAQNMLKVKNLNAVCLNILGEDVNFASEKSRISFITQKNTKTFSLKDKLNIAFEIINASKEL